MAEEIPSALSNMPRAEQSQQIRRRNRIFTPEDRERRWQSALAHRPWQHSTGPRTAAGKAKVAANARCLQKGEKSVRQLRAELADIETLLCEMSDTRRAIVQPITPDSLT